MDVSDVKTIEISLGNLHHEMESGTASDLIENIEIPSEKALKKANSYLLEAVINRISEPVIIKLGSLIVNYTQMRICPLLTLM